MRRFLRAVATAILLAMGGLAVPAAAQSTTPAPPAGSSEADAFGERVRAYLIEHPEVILEALQILQERQKATEADAVKRAITARRDEIFAQPMSPVGGNPGGDVSLVEFFDYNCPYCRQVAPTVRAVQAADKGLRIVYKEFPILGPGSELAAKAALAAQRQGRYAPFHDALMKVSGKVAEDSVLEVAGRVGLDIEQLRRDMKDPAVEEEIARNRKLASALGINGTPGFVIGDHVVPGAVDQAMLQTLIRDVRQGQSRESRP